MTTSLFLYIGMFASLMISARSGEFEFTIMVEPGGIQCFFQPVAEKHKKMEIDYQVVDGGDLNINFMVHLGADLLHQDSMKTENSYSTDIKKAGDYQLCFDNSFSYQSRKVVFFEIFLYDADKNLEEEDLTKYVAADPTLVENLKLIGMTVEQFQSFGVIKNNMNKIEYYQAMLRASETRDRSGMTINNQRVYFWAVFNTIVLVGVAFLQVYMIRSLFEDSAVGKALRR